MLLIPAMRYEVHGIAAFVAAALLSPPAGALVAERCGPAESPEKHADWGGTPDISISPDLGLSLEEIEALLARLASPDPGERAATAAEIERDAAGSEQVIREALWGRHGARNAEMKAAMQKARRIAEDGGRGGDGSVLGALVSMDPAGPETGEGARAATRIMALLTALGSLDTMAAYKTMIEFSTRHAGVFKSEIGEMLVSRGLDALPALVYGRGSEDADLHMYSVKWIRDMGNPLLGEQVRGIEDPRRLAQLLEAYASVNELDAIDVTLSLTDHESIFVRRSARKCLESYGVNAKWPVRRLYENTFGEEPGEDVPVDRLLARLYSHFDERRIARAIGDFDRGAEALRRGDLESMERHYRRVLRDEPMFPRRSEMAEGFLALAKVRERSGDPEAAAAAALMAARVARPGSLEASRAEARRAWLEAEDLRRAGVPDRGLYLRVSQIEPEHDEAAAWARRLSGEGTTVEDIAARAGMVSIFVFLAAALVLRRVGVLRWGRWR